VIVGVEGDCCILSHSTHTHTHTCTVGLLWMKERPVAEAATYTTHNKHKRRTPLPPAGFELAIPAHERPQTHLRPYGHREWPTELHQGLKHMARLLEVPFAYTTKGSFQT